MLLNVFKMFFGDPVSVIINLFIIGITAYVVSKILRVQKELEQNEKEISRLYDGKNVKRDMDKNVNMTVITDTTIDAKKINDLRQKYDQTCVEYSTVSQLIPIFPSLGILGTVLGLMLQVQAEGIEEMTASIGLALSSTCLALLCTVVLKYWMAVSVSKKVSDIEVKYMDYERYRQDLVDKFKLVDGEQTS